jgi:apurinic endonuclease APN1
MMQVEDNCRLGVCFDTCHIFAAGYDLRGQHSLEKVLTEFDKVVGARHIGAFHLNDSRQPLGSKGDRHSVIGAGLLGLEVFRALVTDSRFVTVPGISESPDKGGGCLHDIQLLKRLRAGGLITEVDWCS